GELGDIYYFTGTNYLTVRGGTELLIHGGGKHTWLGEILVYGAPTGGNVDVTTSFGPVVLVRVGGVVGWRQSPARGGRFRWAPRLRPRAGRESCWPPPQSHRWR